MNLLDKMRQNEKDLFILTQKNRGNNPVLTVMYDRAQEELVELEEEIEIAHKFALGVNAVIDRINPLLLTIM